MSEGLKVDFAEIDRMTNGLTEFNTWALPLVPKVGAISADGDLLASAVLSPGTAVAAESAVLTASVQLGVTVASTEALVVITASMVKVYQAADEALSASITSIEAVVHANSLGQFFVRVVVIAGDTVDATHKITWVLAEALNTGLGGTVGEAWDRILSGENASDVMLQLPLFFQKHAAIGLQDGLNRIPGAGYQGLLDAIIRDGSWLGLFEDRPLSLTTGDPELPDRDVDGQRLPDSVSDRNESAYQTSLAALGLDRLTTDDDGRILPEDLASLFAGSSQIDAAGGLDVTDIRVIQTEYADGKYSYIVQIPSTLRWWPDTAAIGNDVTSDVLALQQQQQTALSQAAWDALDRAMRGAGAASDSPVMLSGFSLGGITAGSMAANPGSHNVQQVVTAGAPIGRFDIPASTDVTAFEADGDPVARLDGLDNARGTVAGPPANLRTESRPRDDLLGPADIHNANRYARMAQESGQDSSERFDQYFHGNKKVEDYYGVRK